MLNGEVLQEMCLCTTEAESLSNALCTEGRSLAPLIAPTIGRSLGTMMLHVVGAEWLRHRLLFIEDRSAQQPLGAIFGKSDSDSIHLL